MQALQKDNLKLALEVAGQKGIPAEKVEQMTDVCRQSLLGRDPMMNVAALRCLISMKHACVIEIDTLKMLLQSKHRTLKLAAHVAAAEMAKEEVVLPPELIDLFVTRWAADPLAAAVLIASCTTAVECARRVADAFEYGSRPPPEIAMRLLRAMAVHEEMHAKIEPIVRRFLGEPLATDVQMEFEKLMKRVKE